MPEKFAKQYGIRILQHKRAKKFLKKHNINHYSTYSLMKASVVEQFSRTLKSNMWKQFTHNGNYKWINLLPHLVSKYNARKHRTIGKHATYRCDSHNRQQILKHGVQGLQRKSRRTPAIQSGWLVRVSKFKMIFEKGYMPNWTTEVFRIVKVQKTNPVTYLLQDYREKSVIGGFYEYELYRVANLDVYLIEKVLRKKRMTFTCMAGI